MFSLPMWVTWLILSGLFFIIEIFTISFMMFWPGVGAFVAFILAILGVSIPVQIVVFSIVSIVLIFATKPLTNKFIKGKNVVTNSKTIIGKNGIVLKNIDNINSKGQVKVNGEIWSAYSVDDDIIPENTNIEVVAIDGVKVKVKKI